MTRDEAIASAGEVYGAILADPERREQLRAHRAQQLALRGGARAPSAAVTPRAAAEGPTNTRN